MEDEVEEGSNVVPSICFIERATTSFISHDQSLRNPTIHQRQEKNFDTRVLAALMAVKTRSGNIVGGVHLHYYGLLSVDYRVTREVRIDRVRRKCCRYTLTDGMVPML